MSPFGFGAFAELVSAPQQAFSLKPAGLSMVQAGAVPRAGGLAPHHPDDVAALSRLLHAGTVLPVMDSVVTLDQVPDAFRRFGAQQHTGKIAITI